MLAKTDHSFVTLNVALILSKNDKVLDRTNLKAFTDIRLKAAKMTISLFDRVGNTVGKGENAGYQHFLLFP